MSLVEQKQVEQKKDVTQHDWRGSVHAQLKQIVLDLLGGKISPSEAVTKTNQLNERVIS